MYVSSSGSPNTEDDFEWELLSGRVREPGSEEGERGSEGDSGGSGDLSPEEGRHLQKRYVDHMCQCVLQDCACGIHVHMYI